MNLRAKIEMLKRYEPYSPGACRRAPDGKYIRLSDVLAVLDYEPDSFVCQSVRSALADIFAVMNAEKKIHITPSSADALFPLTVDYERAEIRDARGFWVADGCCEHWKLKEIVRRANSVTAAKEPK